MDVKRLLDERKIAADAGAGVSVTGDVNESTISIRPGTSVADGVPVLIRTTYSPNWLRVDGGPVYPVTPFFMLTFVREPTQLVFTRRPLEWVGLIISALTLFVLFGYVAWRHLEQIVRYFRRRNTAVHVVNH